MLSLQRIRKSIHCHYWKESQFIATIATPTWEIELSNCPNSDSNNACFTNKPICQMISEPDAQSKFRCEHICVLSSCEICVLSGWEISTRMRCQLVSGEKSDIWRICVKSQNNIYFFIFLDESKKIVDFFYCKSCLSIKPKVCVAKSEV